jgi:hypothetical protein
MADQNRVGDRSRPVPVHRLTFDYDGDQISLVSDQVVNMISPPGHSLDESEASADFSVIVRDTANRALYRFTGPSPVGNDAEVFSDDPSDSLHRVPVRKRRGTFVVLVPDLEGATSVELVGQSLDRFRGLSGPRPAARFPLRPPESLS